MNLSDNPPPSDDSDVLQRVRIHSAAVDSALPDLVGQDIRKQAALLGTTSIVKRRRTPFLVAAASVVAVGGLAAYGLSKQSETQQIRTSADTTSLTTAAPTSGATSTPSTSSSIEPADPLDALTPRPVGPGEFGSSELRFLPPADGDFAVSSGAQILMSEADLAPPVALPTRTQRVSLRAADPSDRRGITIEASTFENEAGVDLFLAAEPTAHGTAGEPMAFSGIEGMWSEEEGFAPFSAGNPMRAIVTARVRIGDSTIVDVAAADVSRQEIESLLASLSFDADGNLQSPPAPAGFTAGETIESQRTASAASSDFLSMVLVGPDGEQVELGVFAREDESLGAPSLEVGQSWAETALFGETVVGLVGPDAIFVLTNFDGQVSEAELIALAASLEKVDDATWIERLAIAPLTHNPVMG